MSGSRFNAKARCESVSATGDQQRLNSGFNDRCSLWARRTSARGEPKRTFNPQIKSRFQPVENTKELSNSTRVKGCRSWQRTAEPRNPDATGKPR
jgi:hypothetical protein